MSLLDIAVKVRDLLKDLSLDEKKKILNDVYLDFKISPPEEKLEQKNRLDIKHKALHDLFEEKKAKNFEAKILIAMVAMSESNGNKPSSKSDINNFFDEEVEVFPSTFDREIKGLIKNKLVLAKGEGKARKYQVTTAGKKYFMSMGKEQK